MRIAALTAATLVAIGVLAISATVAVAMVATERSSVRA